MDGSRIDTLVRLSNDVRSRRLALVAALGGLTAGLAASGTTAKRKKKKCKKCKPRDLGEPCQTNKQCCTNETNRACAVKFDASSGDTTCCGATGAQCGSDNDCCADYSCEGGSCQPAPIV